MRKLLIIFIFFSGISLKIKSQNSHETGKVEIVQDYQIKELMDKHLELNSKTTVRGYRVKIHFGTDKAHATEIKDKFIEKYKDIPAYVKYDQPYFSVRVGNYRTKLEAYKFLKQLQGEYEGAFLVQDDVELFK